LAAGLRPDPLGELEGRGGRGGEAKGGDRKGE